jgi:hypothetical protein
MAFHIRDAREDEVPTLAKLHVQTFNETHRGGRSGGPSYELRERQWREAFAAQDGSWFCFVVEDDTGELVGFAKGTLHDGGVPGFVGELNKIYVLRCFIAGAAAGYYCAIRPGGSLSVASRRCSSSGRRRIRPTASTRPSERSGFAAPVASSMVRMVGATCNCSQRGALADDWGKWLSNRQPKLTGAAILAFRA